MNAILNNLKCSRYTMVFRRKRMLFSRRNSALLLVILSLSLVAYMKIASNINEFMQLRNEKYKNEMLLIVSQEATRILKNMDDTVDPCDNFYRFACGNFLKNAVIPDDKSYINAFDELAGKLQEQLKVIIQDEIKESDPRAFKLLRTLYESCMNTDYIERNSEKELIEILYESGGWPILKAHWDEDNFDWIKCVHILRKFGYPSNYFIAFYVTVDFKNSSRRTIIIDQANLGVHRKYLIKGLSDDTLKAYYEYMVDTAEFFWADRQLAEKELKEVLDFQISLAKISIPEEELRNYSKIYNPMTIAELKSRCPFVAWLEYINKILRPQLTIDSSEIVVVTVPSYFESLSKIMENTPKRVLANYIMWRVTDLSMSFLNEKSQKLERDFLAKFTGTNVQKPRWKMCIDFATRNMDLAAGALYVRKYFDHNSKANAIEIMQNVRKSFRKTLDKIEWMDDKTKKIAIEKLDSIKTYIGYPDELLDDRKIDDYYKNLSVHPHSFLKAQLDINIFKLTTSISQLRKPVDKTEWIRHADSIVLNAFYDSSENSIAFPAAILQGVFFSNVRPEYLNYGAIGSFMGHEITHGFDDLGRQFDKNGNLVDWWEAETEKKYLEKAQCIVDQYNNYTVKGVEQNIDGKNTLGENIADNVGFKEAYHAYVDWEERYGQEPSLPGLSLTSRQMYWLSAANVWCEKVRSEQMSLGVALNSHTPGEFRVIGSFSNIPEFAEDFECPLGSPMNPVKKCALW